MNRKILVVDDDKDILDALQLILERESYIVKTIFKGEETYQMVDTFHPDLILLDVLISGNDGRTICKRLKNDKKSKNIPIILISAHPSVANEYKTYGGNEFLPKPFETDELLTLVKKYI